MVSTKCIQDDLSEFFDFDRLEENSTPHITQYQQHHDSSCLEGGITVMDWAVDSICGTSSPQPEDVLMENLLEGGHDEFFCSSWPTQSSSSITVPVDAQGNSGSAPSISPLTYEHSFPIPEHVIEGPGSGSDIKLQDDSSILRHSDPENNAASQKSRPLYRVATRSTAPPRQDAVASWKPASAKRKGTQGRIPLEAKQILEDEFAANPYPCSWEMDIIAHQANLEVKKVRNWFNNTRARNKGQDLDVSKQNTSHGISCSPEASLSRDSLEALDKHADDAIPPPQPPLAVYLAQSYENDAVDVSVVQAAVESRFFASSSDLTEDWSEPRHGPASIITSVASSEGTAPTTYTVSSSGSRSNISSFGRDRRRGRRRMAWKESPHSNRQKFNGVNSAGEPQKDLPFFCTFCPRAFKTKYEWVRHEDSVHALRTTWICCDTKPSSLEVCPFCGHARPDDAHMAGHKYQQCRSKPESQRTFYRRDHFVQHLHHVHFANSKHPSVRIGCQARLMAEEGQHFGCKELAMKWRRFGAPMKRDDPMLHCGFCGKRSKDWAARCEHVAEHLIARDLDRGVWWPERKENHLENLYSASPFESFRCRYCLKIFTDIKDMNSHSHCKVWSCRFLKSFDDVAAGNAGPPLCPDFPSAKAHHCHLCGAGYRTLHSEHAQQYHRHRSCNQEFYTSEEAFLQHLHNFHGASQPALLQGNSIIEQNFMRNKGASFEPVEFNEAWQPCLMDLDTTPIGPFAVDKPLTPTPNNEKKEQSHSKKPSSVRKKSREGSNMAKEVSKPQSRPRSETTSSKVEHLGPRFFRLSTYVPFFSSRIFYSRNSPLTSLPRDSQAVVEELPKPYVASLVMSAGLVGMTVVRMPIRPDKRVANGVVELSLDEAE